MALTPEEMSMRNKFRDAAFMSKLALNLVFIIALIAGGGLLGAAFFFSTGTVLLGGGLIFGAIGLRWLVSVHVSNSVGRAAFAGASAERGNGKED